MKDEGFRIQDSFSICHLTFFICHWKGSKISVDMIENENKQGSEMKNENVK